MDYFLKSRRLGFRYWTNEDFPLAQALWSDSKVTGLFGGPFSPEIVRTRLANEIRIREECGIQYWPIFLLQDHQHVGCAGLRPCPAMKNTWELGYHLHPRFWGQGLATEAAFAVLAHAFSSSSVEAIFAGHHPSNEASRRVLGKVGFEYVGDEFYAPSGVVEPIYVLRRQEWCSHQR